MVDRDRYYYMTTAELEDEAAGRGVDLSDASTNRERAQLLRDADAAQPAPATLDGEPEHGHAPYPSQADLGRRAEVAGGEYGDLQAEG